MMNCCTTGCDNSAFPGRVFCEDCIAQGDELRRYLRAESLPRRRRVRVALILAVVVTIAALTFCGKAQGMDVPEWAIRGIMAAETSSHFRADGSIAYVNRNRGRAGEVGITQAMPSTLREHGFSPSFFEQDRAYALRATRVILGRYFDRTGSWLDAVAMWHRPNDFRSPAAQQYVERVLAAAR